MEISRQESSSENQSNIAVPQRLFCNSSIYKSTNNEKDFDDLTIEIKQELVSSGDENSHSDTDEIQPTEDTNDGILSREENGIEMKLPSDHVKITKSKYSTKWNVENLQKAIKAYKNGMSKRKAANTYGIPWSTFRDKLSGRSKIDAKPVKILTEEEEKELIHWLQLMSGRGFSWTKHNFLLTVKRYLDSKGKNRCSHDNKPGNTWYQCFKKRHPELKFVISSKKLFPEFAFESSLNDGQLKINPEQGIISSWFLKFHNYVNSVDASILLDPERIYNSNEIGFDLKLRGNVFNCVHSKEMRQIEKENKTLISVLVCCSAAGHFTNPMLIYPVTKLNRPQSGDGNERAFITKTKMGWIDADAFADWLEKVFIPQTNHVKKPILLLVNNTLTYQSFRISKICEEHNILLFSLLLNAFHTIQPLDISFYPLLNDSWKETTTKIHAKNFYPDFFQDAYDKIISKELAQDSFRKAGIYPYVPSNLDFPPNTADDDNKSTFTHLSPLPGNTISARSHDITPCPNNIIPVLTEKATPAFPNISEIESSPIDDLLLISAQLGVSTLQKYLQRYKNPQQRPDNEDDPFYEVWKSHYSELKKNLSPSHNSI